MACCGHNITSPMRHLADCMLPKSSITRLVRFALVGVTGALVYYAFLCLLVEVAHMPVMTSTCSAFLFVSFENYFMHYLWTFRSATPHRKSLPRFLFMSAVGFSLNGVIMFVGVECFTFNYLAVQGVAVAVVVLWNFTLANYWIFRRDQGLLNRLSLGRQEDAAQ